MPVILRKIGLIITIFMLLVLGSASAAFADSCSMGRTPEGVYPINDATVTMVDENVLVSIEGDGSTASVDCRFTFKNGGAARSVLMGFPAYGLNWEKDLSAYDLSAAKLKDFRSYVAGSAVDVQEVKAIAPPGAASDAKYFYSWYTFTVPFAAGETREVRNTYRVTLSEGNAGFSAGYILRTGRFWQGPIGHARITFEMGQIPPYQISVLEPYCFRFQGNNLVFEQSNFKPDYDLRVAFYGSDGSNMTKDYIARFQALLFRLSNMNQAELLQEYNRAVQEKYPVMAAYIRGRIPGSAVVSVPPRIDQITVAPWPEAGCNKVSLRVSEPSGDLTSLVLKVSHRENGQEVIDHEDRQAFGGCGYNYNTGVFSDPFTPADYVTFGWLAPGLEYQVAVSVRNVAGQSDSKVVAYQQEDAGSLPETGSLPVTSQRTSPAMTAQSSPRHAASVYPLSAIAALLLLAIVLLVSYRIRKPK